MLIMNYAGLVAEFSVAGHNRQVTTADGVLDAFREHNIDPAICYDVVMGQMLYAAIDNASLPVLLGFVDYLRNYDGSGSETLYSLDFPVELRYRAVAASVQ